MSRKQQPFRVVGRVLGLAVAVVTLMPVAAQAQGSIGGCVTDRHGGALPGVEVTLSSRSTQHRAVTDVTGCYRATGLAPGTYAVTATLVGFVPATNDGIELRSGQLIGSVNFALCLGALQEVDYVTYGGLVEAWRAADIVAHVRIVATTPVVTACPTADVRHTATVVESFKERRAAPTASRLVFRQEQWSSETTPYAIGQELVVFLVASKGELFRLSGPFYVFQLDGDEILSFHSPVKTDGMTAADLLARLRRLAQESKGP